MTYKLSIRLQSALALVPDGANVIDVGADHGLLSIALAKKGHSVLAIENKQGPFSILQKNIADSCLPNIECHLSDGIQYLPGYIDCACILGMGGATIIKILSYNLNALSQLNTIIIEPQSCMEETISFMLSQGYINDEGYYVFEKRYYPLLRFIKSKDKSSIPLLGKKYGPIPVKKKDPLLIRYLETEIRRYNEINTSEAQGKALNLLNELQEIQK